MASLKDRIERALARLYPPGSRCLKLQNPIVLKVVEIDESTGNTTIDIGACTFDEGTKYGMQIKAYLVKKFPELNNVTILIKETD